MLTQDRLKEELSYNPDTGLFIRIKDNKYSQAAKKGVVISSINNKGYLRVKIDYKSYNLHRLAWLYMFGEFPDKLIDHIDGDKLNNKLDNLRLCTQAENLQNQKKAQKGSRVDFLGVAKRKTGYEASIRHKRKPYYLGLYSTPEEAHEVYLKKKRELHEFCTI